MKAFAHRMSLALAVAGLGGSAPALAQHAVRPKDAEAPVSAKSDLDDDLSQPAAAPAAKPGAAPAQKAQGAPAPLPDEGPPKPPDAGPQKFKDDLTADDARAAGSSSVAATSCAGGGCEAILSRTLESTAFTLRVRPSTPRPGRVVELVLELFEVMDPPDPEYGERKPMTGEQLVAHVEGIGRFLMHPLDRNDGAYGFHFTPSTAGAHEVDFDRLDGKPGLRVSFRVNVGQPPERGAELREWHPAGADRYKAVPVAAAGSPGEGE